jgi:hypothetical protein
MEIKIFGLSQVTDEINIIYAYLHQVRHVKQQLVVNLRILNPKIQQHELLLEQ